MAVLVTVAAFLLLSKLAWWQWQRAEEKAQQIEQIAAWQTQKGIDVSVLHTAVLSTLDGAPLQGQVQWVPPFIWLIDNQIVKGMVGYDVLIPVRVAAEAPILLLNLGWTAGTADRSKLPKVEVPAVIELQGLLRVEPRPFVLGQNIEKGSEYPHRIQAIVPDQLAETSGLPLLDAVFYQQKSSFISHYQPVILPPEKHRAYALQWALLAVAVVFVALAVRHQRGRHE
jgi:cytochrome oxidase assembly protein ShyY1